MGIEKGISWLRQNELLLVQFDNFNKYNSIISHAFTTRLGGVSSGECEYLNLGVNRNDSLENVLKNYNIVGSALNILTENMVLSRQVHDNKILEVSEDDRGKGLLKENNLLGYDGLMTDKKEVALVTFYADCVPVFFLDPIKKVIAISHSGWKGTVKEIAKETIQLLKSRYKCEVSDIETAIGPAIMQCCFEVGDEVYEEFSQKLQWSTKYCKKIEETNKWHINLQAIIRQSLINQGVLEGKINWGEICTKCNKDIFFSHRGDNGRTGSLAGIIQLI